MQSQINSIKSKTKQLDFDQTGEPFFAELEGFCDRKEKLMKIL